MTALFNQLINYSNYKSILCLNGELPDRLFYDTTLPIVAADGAANQLDALAIEPHAIVGDLDSVHAHVKAKHQVIHLLDQDTCDYQKCLAYLRDNRLLPTIVTGINGGYLDHILNNINIFLQSDNLLYAPPVIGMTVNEGRTKTFELPLNTKLSLIGFPNAVVTTHGLKWELQQTELSFPGANSYFNRSVTHQVDVTIEKGKALLLIYLQEMKDAGSH